MCISRGESAEVAVYHAAITDSKRSGARVKLLRLHAYMEGAARLCAYPNSAYLWPGSNTATARIRSDTLVTVRLAWFALMAACSFSPQSEIQSDSAPNDSAGADAPSDGRLADAPPSDAPVPACPSGYVHIGSLPSLYKIYGWSKDSRGRSFTAAAQLCAGSRTHLAILDSADEASALWSAIALNPRSPYFWDGITDAAAEGTWLTVRGAPASYQPWEAGAPSGGTLADCALANGAHIYDWPCGTPYPFACECE